MRNTWQVESLSKDYTICRPLKDNLISRCPGRVYVYKDLTAVSLPQHNPAAIGMCCRAILDDLFTRMGCHETG